MPSENRIFRTACARFLKAFTLAMFGWANQAIGGPDEITNRLMDEGVSLLDWGILRIQMRLSSDTRISSALVSYDWENNQIMIEGSNYDNGTGKPEEDAQKECSQWFRSIRLSAMVDPDTGKPYFGEASIFARLFEHEGWEKTVDGKSTSDVATSLDGKIFLKYYVYMKADSVGDTDGLYCTAKLLEAGFSRQEDIKK